MLLEDFLHLEVADVVTSGIEVEQAVEADALNRSNERASGREGLQTATGADANHSQRTMLRLLLTGVVVDVSQRVEFVDHDIDVVAADTMRLSGDALAFVHTGNGMELTATDFVFDAVEVGSNGVYACRVTNEDDFVCQVFRLQMKVKT